MPIGILPFSAFKFNSILKFPQSPEDFEQKHQEGDEEIPGTPGVLLTSGFLSPGTAASDAAVGDQAWANPDNIKVSDDTYSDGGGFHAIPWTTQYIKGTNFSNTIPTDATILGIEVKIEHLGDFTGEIRDIIVRLVDEAGTVVGDNKKTATLWTTTEEIFTYGGSSDLWGISWTPAKVNHANFGVVLSAEVFAGGGGNTILVDHISLNVHYQT